MIDWSKVGRGLDTFVDVVWPTMIAVAVLAVAAFAAGTYASEALLAPFGK